MTLPASVAPRLQPTPLPAPTELSFDRFVIAVGSNSPAKINATQRSFCSVWPNDPWTVVHAEGLVDFDGIPVGGGETQDQARNRASFALSHFPRAQFGVGIQSGLFRANKRWFECTWIVIHDRNGTEGMGSSAAIEIKKKYAIRLQGGETLGNICRKLFGNAYTNDEDGYFGALTNGGTNRVEVYVGGIMPALARFSHPEAFQD